MNKEEALSIVNQIIGSRRFVLHDPQVEIFYEERCAFGIRIKMCEIVAEFRNKAGGDFDVFSKYLTNSGIVKGMEFSIVDPSMDENDEPASIPEDKFADKVSQFFYDYGQ